MNRRGDRGARGRKEGQGRDLIGRTHSPLAKLRRVLATHATRQRKKERE